LAVIAVTLVCKVTYPKHEFPKGTWKPESWKVTNTLDDQIEIKVAKVKPEKI
jgi:hypothetical protein